MSDEYVWVIDDDHSIRWVLEKAFKQANIHVSCFKSADEALEMLHTNATPPDAIISDVRMPGSDGLALLKQLKQHQTDTPVLIMTAFSDLDSTVAAYDGGAYEYIPKPFDVDDVILKTRRACQPLRDKRGDNTSHRTAIANGSASTTTTATNNGRDQYEHDLLGESSAMKDVFKAIGRLSRSNNPVLIVGETGTGKELIAHALHKRSPRANKPFTTLNISSIPNELLESELFGHEKKAEGGTLFFDEVGDMPTSLQTRLLRTLADGEFYRVGGQDPIKINVRIVAATQQNLSRLVEEKRFREDLFHRLNVIRIDAPPLRDRADDIPLLMNHFLAQAAKEQNEESKTMDASFKRHITTLPWPGNVRQLENTAHWLTAMAVNKELSSDDLPAAEQSLGDEYSWQTSFEHWATTLLRDGESDLLAKAVPTMERILIRCALAQSENRKQEAAKLLGWGRNTLTRKIKELQIDD